MSSNRDRRLDRLYPALTAKERALLVLKHYKEGTEAPPAIRSSLSAYQRQEYNRLIGLMNAVNVELAFALRVVQSNVRQLDLKYLGLMSLMLACDEIYEFGQTMLGQAQDAKFKRQIRKQLAQAPGQIRVPVDLTLPHERLPGEHWMDSSVRALVVGITRGLELHWCELRSMEIAVAEVAEEFDGEDPLHADTRAMLDAAKATCVEVHDAIKLYVEPFELPEPSDDDVALVRKLIAKAADGLAWVSVPRRVERVQSWNAKESTPRTSGMKPSITG